MTPPRSSSHPGAPARLSIRAALEGRRTASRVQALLLGLRTRCGLAAACPVAPAAVIDIRDLQGRRVLEVREARPPLDLDLPPGTYHVSIGAGGQRRLYTVVLEPGAACVLRVHGAARELAC